MGNLSGSGPINVDSSTLEFVGDNSGFSGDLNVASGTLEFSSEWLNAGALNLSGGNLLFNDQNVSFDSVEIDGDISISLSNSDGISQNIGLGDLAYISGTITIFGWTDSGTRDTFSVNSPPTAEFLQNVSFAGFGTGAQFLNGTLVPVPEPTTIALLAGGIAFFFVRRQLKER